MALLLYLKFPSIGEKEGELCQERVFFMKLKKV